MEWRPIIHTGMDEFFGLPKRCCLWPLTSDHSRPARSISRLHRRKIIISHTRGALRVGTMSISSQPNIGQTTPNLAKLGVVRPILGGMPFKVFVTYEKEVVINNMQNPVSAQFGLFSKGVNNGGGHQLCSNNIFFSLFALIIFVTTKIQTHRWRLVMAEKTYSQSLGPWYCHISFGRGLGSYQTYNELGRC